MDLLNQFAAAHPFYLAALSAGGGFFLRHVLLTKDTARKLVKWYFDWQRRALRKKGVSEAKIKEVMQDEATVLANLAEEAQAEASAEPASDAPQPPAS